MKGSPSSAGQGTHLPQRDKVPRPFLRTPAENDVVHKFDLKQLSGPHQVPGHFDVLLAGRGIAAGMVVHDHDGRRPGGNGRSEHLARVNEQGVQSSLGQHPHPDHAPPGIEEDHLKTTVRRTGSNASISYGGCLRPRAGGNVERGGCTRSRIGIVGCSASAGGCALLLDISRGDRTDSVEAVGCSPGFAVPLKTNTTTNGGS